MKLRFVEREIHTPVDGMTPDIMQRKVVRILQYWLPQDEWSVNGEWVDVPLEVEELDK